MSRQFNVLVVDDDESRRKLLYSVLEAEGHSCQLADSLGTAELLLRQQQMDLALVDLYLGTENGLNVLDLLKVTQPQCKCVVMTAHATLETVTRSLSGGALEYLSKPLPIDDLLSFFPKLETRRPAETEIAPARPAPATATL